MMGRYTAISVGMALVCAGLSQIAEAQVTPGLFEGRVDGVLNLTADNPNSSIQLSTRYANIVDSGASYQNTQGAWAPGNKTFIYSGYIHQSNSDPVTWTFGELFDDTVWLKIGQQVVLQDMMWNVQTTADCTLLPGWHRFELRLGEGSGEVGPANGGVEGSGLGVAYNDGTGWHAITDGGTGNFLSATNPVPEPSTFALLGAGAIGLACAWRRRERSP